jgi:5'(3')-deoxyribonucleotidase
MRFTILLLSTLILLGSFYFLSLVFNLPIFTVFLSTVFVVWILTRPSVHNLSCYTEKAQWIRKYLGFEMQSKTIMCVDKSLLKGHFLVDDQIEHGQAEFEGKHIHFGSDEFNNWDKVVTYLMSNKDFITQRQIESFCGC